MAREKMKRYQVQYMQPGSVGGQDWATDSLPEARRVYAGWAKQESGGTLNLVDRRRWKSLAKKELPYKSASNPPSGFIPCKAVKITRNKGKVEVRIRK